MSNPTASFRTITPAMAKRFLEKNTNNRSMNEVNLAGIVSEMNRKNFHLTGESIKIAENGDLLDGQHRLMAIVKTGQSIKMLVVEGLENTSFKYIDTGRKRQASDVLAIEKIKNPAKIAAMCKFIINFQRGNFIHAATQRADRFKARLTNADISTFVEKNKESIYDSYPYGFNRQNKLISGTFLSSFHYIVKKIDEVKADDFCHKLGTGEDVQKDSSISLLRQRLLADIRAKNKMKPLEKMALICKAWNLYRSNKKVTILTWNSTREAFPKPI